MEQMCVAASPEHKLDIKASVANTMVAIVEVAQIISQGPVPKSMEEQFLKCLTQKESEKAVQIVAQEPVPNRAEDQTLDVPSLQVQFAEAAKAIPHMPVQERTERQVVNVTVRQFQGTVEVSRAVPPELQFERLKMHERIVGGHTTDVRALRKRADLGRARSPVPLEC